MGTTRAIVNKAMKDAEFRTRLMKDPKAAIEKEFGVQFPDGVKVQVHQNTADVVNVVLPSPLEVSTDRSLSQQELEQVAGGLMKNNPIKGGDTFGSYTGCCS